VISDQDFVTMQDFIVGRLSDAQRQAFEDRLLQEPRLVAELEQSLRIRAGLERLHSQGYFRKTASRDGRLRIWVPTLAAAAGAGVALFLWLSRAAAPSPILVPSFESRDATAVTSPVAAHFTFVSVRGGHKPDLALPSAGRIEIRAAPGTRGIGQRYRATLLREQEGAAAQSVAAVAGLALATDGYVYCYADASRLQPGSYVLRLQPDSDAEGSADEFAFNLRLRGTDSSR
jgi:hypothetical protein